MITNGLRTIRIRGIAIHIVRKPIKHLHLAVYPPAGAVRVAAPLALSDDAVRLAVIGRLPWIRKQRARFGAQPRQSRRAMVGGESHYYLGRRYRLKVIERQGRPEVAISAQTLVLGVPPGATKAARTRAVQNWYRVQLKELVPALIEKWRRRAAVEIFGWRVRRMKTKWGSFSPTSRRITLNLELAKKPVGCIEFVVLHELVHLRERHHNDRFVAYMDSLMPDWRVRRSALNVGPLAHERWTY